MTQKLFCGIDTSNYTTSVALADRNGTVLLNQKKLLPVKEGERGLRQSDAVFHHVKQLPEVLAPVREMIASLGDASICAIGVSATPRDADGSYMPCFLSGIAAAETAGALLGVPVLRFSHQAGHIMAALYSADRLAWMARDFVAFHVSGGTTEILHVKPDPITVFSIEQIGGTADINAGQAIDRAGVHMGLMFPAGAEMERLASSCEGKVPSAKISVSGMTCNLSGLENRAQKLYASTGDRALVSAFVLDFVGRTLASMRDGVRAVYGDIPILYAGGVMSCARIKKMLAEDMAAFAQPAFSSDNACGAALLARHAYLTAEV
ncbi:MAG: peptidase M22 [Clostridia bacterium]|nr:peptidase M22 [Clostridia bacterium]